MDFNHMATCSPIYSKIQKDRIKATNGKKKFMTNEPCQSHKIDDEPELFGLDYPSISISV